MNLSNQGASSCTRVNSFSQAIMIMWFPTAHEMDARRRMISKNFHHVMRMSERQALTGPPESMREHVVAASKAMKTGNWKECKNYIINEKMNAKVRSSLQMLHIVIVWMEFLCWVSKWGYSKCTFYFVLYRCGNFSTRVRLCRRWWQARSRKRASGLTCSPTAAFTTHWA